MADLRKSIEGIEVPQNVRRIIEEAKTDGSIASIKDVIKRESLSLMEKTDNSFKRLCRTLDEEQARLTALEEKRIQLQKDMLLLKAEIEAEKEKCRLDLEEAHCNLDELRNLETIEEVDEKEGNDELQLVFSRHSDASEMKRIDYEN